MPLISFLCAVHCIGYAEVKHALGMDKSKTKEGHRERKHHTGEEAGCADASSLLTRQVGQQQP
jgi:hypothetical protein